VDRAEQPPVPPVEQLVVLVAEPVVLVAEQAALGAVPDR
jgi:hypothetical protein